MADGKNSGRDEGADEIRSLNNDPPEDMLELDDALLEDVTGGACTDFNCDNHWC